MDRIRPIAGVRGDGAPGAGPRVPRRREGAGSHRGDRARARSERAGLRDVPRCHRPAPPVGAGLGRGVGRPPR